MTLSLVYVFREQCVTCVLCAFCWFFCFYLHCLLCLCLSYTSRTILVLNKCRIYRLYVIATPALTKIKLRYLSAVFVRFPTQRHIVDVRISQLGTEVSFARRRHWRSDRQADVYSWCGHSTEYGHHSLVPLPCRQGHRLHGWPLSRHTVRQNTAPLPPLPS